ncbi:MAG: isocitrate lyase/phosphoenolpyruvate mutase family protein [Acidobacteriia bacterium]|nr:isocitrate lyase/phosphoenolpyruvate mutase family protein [Terriglobia bacterium]
MENKADLLRSLHRPTLVIGNAWDVAGARIFERAGFAAIGSSSAGVAFALGYPDGQKISREEMLEVVARMAKAVKIPVTADVEAGYDDPVETAHRVWAAGAVGMNLEDTAGSEELIDLRPIIRSIRAAVPKMVINARTDIFLNQIGDAATRFDRAVERLRMYRDAGADCLFAPGVRDRETIGQLVAALQAPLNILATAGSPPIAEMKSLGVARVSVGSGPMRATLGLCDRIARELHDQGTYTSMIEGAIPYADVNRLLS